MIPVISDAGPPASSDDIVATERSLGVKLPDEYVRFLGETNGGRPRPASFGDDARGGSRLAFFMRVNGGDHDDLVSETQRLEPPHGFILVGADVGGNYVCLAADAARSGQVYFWPRDDDEAPFKIADTFGEFLASFYEREAKAPAPPPAPPKTTLADARAELERGKDILRDLQAREARVDAIVDALLVVASSAEVAINERGGATTYAELFGTLRQAAAKDAWSRKRRAPAPSFGPVEDLEACRAQDELFMRATVDHHIRDVSSYARVATILKAVSDARDALLALGEDAAGPCIASLEAAGFDAFDWLDEEKARSKAP